MSPIVISEDNILIKLPFRLTFEYKGFNFLSPSIACSDFISWIAPIKELVKTTNKIIDGSIKLINNSVEYFHFTWKPWTIDIIYESNVAHNKIITSKSLNWLRYIKKEFFFFLTASSFFPNISWRFFTSSLFRPSSIFVFKYAE